MKYPSKIDLWVGSVLALAPAILLLEAFFLHSRMIWLVAASVFVVYGLFVFPTNYELGPDALIVRSGLIRRSIPYHEIRQVRASRSPLSSPALSMDRLAIACGSSRTILISPRDRAAFLRDLSTRIPDLRTDLLSIAGTQALEQPR